MKKSLMRNDLSLVEKSWLNRRINDTHRELECLQIDDDEKSNGLLVNVTIAALTVDR